MINEHSAQIARGFLLRGFETTTTAYGGARSSAPLQDLRGYIETPPQIERSERVNAASVVRFQICYSSTDRCSYNVAMNYHNTLRQSCTATCIYMMTVIPVLIGNLGIGVINCFLFLVRRCGDDIARTSSALELSADLLWELRLKTANTTTSTSTLLKNFTDLLRLKIAKKMTDDEHFAQKLHESAP
nr:hypothetical protein Itr_chr13CG17550 [Ipomoea trifida]